MTTLGALGAALPATHANARHPRQPGNQNQGARPKGQNGRTQRARNLQVLPTHRGHRGHRGHAHPSHPPSLSCRTQPGDPPKRASSRPRRGRRWCGLEAGLDRRPSDRGLVHPQAAAHELGKSRALPVVQGQLGLVLTRGCIGYRPTAWSGLDPPPRRDPTAAFAGSRDTATHVGLLWGGPHAWRADCSHGAQLFAVRIYSVRAPGRAWAARRPCVRAWDVYAQCTCSGRAFAARANSFSVNAKNLKSRRSVCLGTCTQQTIQHPPPPINPTTARCRARERRASRVSAARAPGGRRRV
jgi:hypothetical protein